MTTVTTGDAKAARDKRRKELRDALLELGGTDASVLRDIIVELLEELPTPSLEMVVEHLTNKQDALGETVMGDKADMLGETVTVMSTKSD